MQSLDSKNYNQVNVYIRDRPEPITLNRQRGDGLMSWLTDPKTSQISHVQLTDISGSTGLYARYDIKRVEPEYIHEPHIFTDKEMEDLFNGK